MSHLVMDGKYKFDKLGLFIHAIEADREICHNWRQLPTPNDVPKCRKDDCKIDRERLQPKKAKVGRGSNGSPDSKAPYA